LTSVRGTIRPTQKNENSNSKDLHYLSLFPTCNIHHPNIIMNSVILATLLSSAAAFAPQSTGRVSTAVNEVNWQPNESEFAYGLPGSLAPVGEFDPLGFAKDTPLATMLQWREAVSYSVYWLYRFTQMLTILFTSGNTTRTRCHACRAWHVGC